MSKTIADDPSNHVPVFMIERAERERFVAMQLAGCITIDEMRAFIPPSVFVTDEPIKELNTEDGNNADSN